MDQTATVLSVVCYAGALAGLICYIYGYILKSRGDRRWHTAGLLFSTLALANLPMLLRNGAAAGAMFNAALLVTFLYLALISQAITSLRGRRGDRRAPRDAAQSEAQPSPRDAA